MNLRVRYTIFIVLFCALGFAQTHTGKLGVITADGLHKIELSSNLRSAANDNFDHFRILDASGNEVPYVLLNYQSQWLREFVPMEIASKTILKDSVTSLVVANPNKYLKESITLKIVSTRLQKNYKVYGSNDQKIWYGLTEGRLITTKGSTRASIIENTIDFPLNDYSYLKIDFDDQRSAPYNILEAGNYESKFFNIRPVEIEDFKIDFKIDREEKNTQIKISSEEAYKVDFIAFKVETQYFQRDAKLFVKKTRQTKKSTEIYDDFVAGFQLKSNQQNWFSVRNLNAKEFNIKIDNQDNPPLLITDIRLFQKPLYLVANLKVSEIYQIKIDTTLQRPSYDLKNFVYNDTKVVNVARIESLAKVTSDEKKVDELPFWKTKTFMWVCIVLGSVMIVYIAIGLMRDVKEN